MNFILGNTQMSVQTWLMMVISVQADQSVIFYLPETQCDGVSNVYKALQASFIPPPSDNHTSLINLHYRPSNP